jgi:quinolinate synthase
MTPEELKQQINLLRREKNAVILAHYYQEAAIQEIADYVGDSLGLSQQACASGADIIVFAGVHFMAETAKIFNPNSKVLLPDLDAGCSLAESCPSEKLALFRKQYPDHLAITYINCSAEVKANSDIICTSSNALKIINSIPDHKPILFAPDKNLGKYLMQQTGRDMLLWDGVCEVHAVFSRKKLQALAQKFPDAKILAHPESDQEILQMADFIGSTAAMISHVTWSPDQTFIVATEVGILHKMSQAVPSKTLIPAPSIENNNCACSECRFMKMNTLEKLYLCLKNETPEILIPEDIRIKALKPLQIMMEMSITC